MYILNGDNWWFMITFKTMSLSTSGSYGSKQFALPYNPKLNGLKCDTVCFSGAKLPEAKTAGVVLQSAASHLVPKEQHTRIFSQDSIWKNVEQYRYGTRAENHFYVLRPQEEKNNGKLMIFLHGGGFLNSAATADSDPIFKRFLDKGFTLATVDYPYLGNANNSPIPFHLIMDDISKGVTAAYHTLAKDAKEVVLAGVSAGAAASALLLYSDKFPEIPKIDKFVGFAGVYNPDAVSEGLNGWVRGETPNHQDFSSLLRAENGQALLAGNPRTQTPALLLQGGDDSTDDKHGDPASSAYWLKCRLSGSENNPNCQFAYINDDGYNHHTGVVDAVADGKTEASKLFDKFFGLK